MKDLLISKLGQYATRTAIIDNDKAFTYSDLLNDIITRYEKIKASVEKGEIVLLRSGYNFDGISTLFALALNENIIVPVGESSQVEADQRTLLSGASKVIDFHQGNFEIIPVPVDRSGSRDSSSLIRELNELSNPGIVLFSSGITGQPKAMVHNFHKFLEPYFQKRSKSLNFMAMLLFDHIGGLNTLLTALFSGATLTIPKSNDPDIICRQIEKHKVNILPGSPTMLNLIYISGAYLNYDLSSLKIITYGTEPMPEGLLQKLNSIFPPTRFMQTYGTSETGISKMSSKSSSSLKFKFDDPNTEIKIVDGELWIKSSTTIIGYLNAEMQNFTNDGWFKTGDMVEQDDDGYIYIKGRNNNIINVGGLKVFPQEVESVLMKLPFIENCVVYGEKSSITGNIVVCDIQLSKEQKADNTKALILSFCRENMERYKVPVKIRFVDLIEYNDRFKKLIK